MKTNVKKSSGFTLIELMIVFVIIIVLAGMVLRLMGIGTVKNAEAGTRERLEQVAHALEEFRATYGRYPPVDYYPGVGQPMEYEYAHTNMMEPAVQDVIRQRSRTENLWAQGGKVFTFGLISYFVPRYTGHASASPDIFVGGTGTYSDNKVINQWKDYNERKDGTIQGDIVQNIESSRRILPYLGGSLRPNGTMEKNGIIDGWPTGLISVPNSALTYRNMHMTIRDGWGNPLRYESRPPYDSYKLWSAGPDGRSVSTEALTLEDDIVVGQD